MQKTSMSLRIFLVLLAVLMVIPMVLTACSGGGDDPGKTEETTAEEQNGENDVDVNGNKRVASGHEGFDYGGETFTIFISGDWATDDIWVDEENYDKTDDVATSVVTRNGRLEERYGVEIKQVEAPDEAVYAFISNSINAGDNQFDAISTGCCDCVKLALEGLLYDLNELETIQTDREWWDQEMVKQCTLGGHLFWLVGEYTTTDNQATHAMVFNKKMFAQNAEKIGEKSPYEYVNDGTWTLDTLFRLAGAVGQDKDGNSKYDEDDIFGLTYPQTACFAFINCCGIKQGSVHESEPYITCDLWSEKTADVWSKVIDMTKQNWSYNWHREMKAKATEDMFTNNQILFFLTYMSGIAELRSAADGFEFGILPYPKYDEAQEEYISPFHQYGTPFLCIPITNKRAEDAGAVIDLLSYESMYTLTPAYYNITLEGKLTRDNESLDMLNLIFTTKCYDFGFISGWAKWRNEGPLQQLWNNKTENLASRFESSRRGIEQAIQKQLDSYEEYESKH